MRLVRWFWTSCFLPRFQLLLPRPSSCRSLLRLLVIMPRFQPLQPRPAFCCLLWCSPLVVPTLRGCPLLPSSPLEVPTLRGSSAGSSLSKPCPRRLRNGSGSRLRRLRRRSRRKWLIRSRRQSTSPIWPRLRVCVVWRRRI